MKKQNIIIIASILFMLIGFVCLAQSVPPPSPSGRTPGPPGDTVPIDGGVLLGILAGVFIGVKKLLKR